MIWFAMQDNPVCAKRLRKGASAPSQIFESKVKHHVDTNAANCFSMQFACTVLLNMLCKYAKRLMERIEKCEGMCGERKREEREGRERGQTRSVHTPAPEIQTQNCQPSSPAMFQLFLLASKTVGRQRQTVRVFLRVGLFAHMQCPNVLCDCLESVCFCLERHCVCVST